METKQLVILIAAGIIILVVGIGLGIIIKPQSSAQVQKSEAVSNLSSKVISSITAYGKVTNIQGNNITLNNLGESLVISVTANANVFSFVVPAGAGASATPVQKQVSFENLKIGDNVNVIVKVLPSGQMQGSSVIILPATAQK